MKENNNGNDTNVGSMENSIKEDIEILVAFILAPSLKHISEDEFKDVQKAIKHILSDYKRALKENEEFRNFLEKIIREYIPDYELEQLIDRYKNESFIPRVEVKKILEDRRK